MSLKMYLAESDMQKSSMNSICIDLILAMEQMQSSIHSFTFNMSLRGQTYDSAKTYMNKIFLPLTQGVIYLCEELIRQNDKYPDDFKNEVSPTDVVEEEVQSQINEIDQMIISFQQLNESLPLLNVQILIYEQMKRKLLQKLSDLYAFNSTSKSNYTTALDFAESVLEGLSQIQGGRGFNKASGTFNTNGIDMSWVKDLSATHYTRRAKEEFGDYIAKDLDNLDKVVKILQYEDANLEDAKKVTEFLSSLEEQDIMEIKYLMYTAKEPYLTISMKYLNRFNKRDTDSGGLFDSSDNAIDFTIEKDRNNNRGNYYTFFHEVFHAADFYHGIDQGYESHYSSFYGLDEGKNLNDYMEDDAKTHFQQELAKIIQDSKYVALSDSEKQEMIDNVTENLMMQDDYYVSLSPEEKELNNTIRSHYENILHGPAHNTASDVYGGITNFVISGNYGHQEEDGSPSDYWFVDAKGGVDGERTRYPNREGIAEYFGRIMTDEREVAIKSIEEFLPESKEFMDEIFDRMVE